MDHWRAFGAELRRRREAREKSLRSLAKSVAYDPGALSRIEHGLRKPPPDLVRALDDRLSAEGELVRMAATEPEAPAVAPTGVASPGEDELGERSSHRTALLLHAAPRDDVDIDYEPDPVAVECFQHFLDSPTRVFVLTGGAGSGKTSLTTHLAHQWSNHLNFQLHTCATWALPTVSVAAEVLRYASLPGGNDPLLALENAAHTMRRPCLVVVDGIDSDQQLTVVGRQLDSILRQVNSNHLRFMIVARTPPEPDLSAFPLLAAVTFARTGAPNSASHAMMAWTPSQARTLWNRGLTSRQMPFTDLPTSLQSLATIPLYMRMLRDAGSLNQAPTGALNAYHLVDHCVRTVLSRDNQPAAIAMDNLTELACRLMPEAIPDPLALAVGNPNRDPTADIATRRSPFVDSDSNGQNRFTHDVFREYFLAVWIVDQIKVRGRSAATIAAFDELAVHATHSAATRGVFDFVVCGLDASAPHLIEAIALAPSITLDTALPMLLETAADHGGLASVDVIQACAHRSTQSPTRPLARALLATPNLAEALGNQHAPWIVGQLRTYGSDIWGDVAHHVQTALDVRISTRIVDCIDLDRAEEATFLARHLDLFATGGPDPTDLLHRLTHHLDWRVRAGLAEALRQRRPLGPAPTNRVIDQLVRDDDYKVRAAVANAIGMLDDHAASRHLEHLLGDPNWHVRERALQAVMTGPQAPLPNPELARVALIHTANDSSWTIPPAPVAKLLSRIRLLHEPGLHLAQPSDDNALFGLLRELRTGWIDLPNDLAHSLASHADTSDHWLTVREAHAVHRQLTHPTTTMTGIREQYRRRLGHRALQVALDVHTLDGAIQIAEAAVAAGADFIEVGDPLIKRAGVMAIETIKNHALDTPVVAEMMSADWGRDQVELAAEAGADIVLLIGPASVASVSAAVAAARRLGVAITLDAPPQRIGPAWLRDMERAGIDGFVVTTNIDLGVANNHPLLTARTIRACSRLPIAISGGFSTADHALAASNDWDIAIVGRSIADAVAPADMAHQLSTIVHKIHDKERP